MGNRNLSELNHHILICNGESCLRNGGDEVTLKIREQIKYKNADHHIHTTRTRCNGRCDDACVVIVYPSGDWYRNFSKEDCRQLIDDLVTKQLSLESKKTHSFSAPVVP